MVGRPPGLSTSLALAGSLVAGLLMTGQQGASGPSNAAAVIEPFVFASLFYI